jgi:RNA polymerase sigma-70 factor (ECF subfamily)
VRVQAVPAIDVRKLSDEELVCRIRGGEKTLFEGLMRRYNQRLFRLARAVVRDDAEAEDVLQEAYVRCYAHLGQLQDPTRLASWLSHIVVHEARARLRRRARLTNVAEKGGPLRAVVSPAADPEKQAVGRQLGLVLAKAIDALPLGYRVVFVLRDVEGLSTAEVAESVGITEMAVKTRLHRARAALRDELFARVGTEALPPFQFDGARCDRIVANVLARI